MIIVTYSGIILVSLLLVFLFIKGGKKANDYLLLGILVCFLCNLFVPILYLREGSKLFSLLLELTNVFMLCLGPLLWLYTRSLMEHPFKFSSKIYLHFIPAIVFLFLTLLGHWTSFELSSIRIFITVLIFIMILFYLWKSFQSLAEHRANVESVYSDTTNRDLGWLSFLMIGLLVIWIIGAISSLVLNEWLQIQIPMYGALYTNISASIFAVALGFMGLQQKIVFDPETPSPIADHIEEVKDLRTPEQSIKYLKTGLDFSAANQHYETLLTQMQQGDLHLDPDLTLYKLASHMRITPNQLSQVINSNAKMNFFDFINRYRVQSFIDKFGDSVHSHKTILSLAYESGFNSKSAFNRSFKKVTGETPSAYRKSKMG